MIRSLGWWMYPWRRIYESNINIFQSLYGIYRAWFVGVWSTGQSRVSFSSCAVSAHEFASGVASQRMHLGLLANQGERDTLMRYRDLLCFFNVTSYRNVEFCHKFLGWEQQGGNNLLSIEKLLICQTPIDCCITNLHCCVLLLDFHTFIASVSQTGSWQGGSCLPAVLNQHWSERMKELIHVI